MTVDHAPPIRLARPIPVPSGVAEQRRLLADLLTEAAEIEHTVMSMYLFAAFGLKQTPAEGGVSYAQVELMRQWKATLLTIARQEMEHLGIVCNLLTAIGEAPRLRTRASSIDTTTSRFVAGRFDLAPLNPGQVLRFVCFEMPAQLDAADLATLQAAIPGFDPANYDGLLQLYQAIRNLLSIIDGDAVFVGPPTAQTSTSDVFPAGIRGISTEGKPAYNVTLAPVTNQVSALAAVDLVVKEGEGATVGDPTCHFASFLTIYRQLTAALASDPSFAPSRPVGVNPSLAPDPAGTLVTLPITCAMMQLFDDSFAVLVELLARFFMHTDEAEDQIAALERAAFMPMMTAVVRPLAEMITLMPVATGSTVCAGPSFDLPERDAFLPHRTAAWRVLHLELESLRDQADALRRDPALPLAMQPRLQLMWENLVRVASDFALRMGVRADDRNDRQEAST